jgi:hypothetical protein
MKSAQQYQWIDAPYECQECARYSVRDSVRDLLRVTHRKFIKLAIIPLSHYLSERITTMSHRLKKIPSERKKLLKLLIEETVPSKGRQIKRAIEDLEQLSSLLAEWVALDQAHLRAIREQELFKVGIGLLDQPD